MFLYSYSLFHRIWQFFLLRSTRPNFNMGWTWLTFSRGWMNFGRVWLGRIWQNFGWRRLHQIWTNFGRGRRDQIWAKDDLTKFQWRSTWLDSTEFRSGPILLNTTKFWPKPTWPNMTTFRLGPDQSNFG